MSRKHKHKHAPPIQNTVVVQAGQEGTIENSMGFEMAGLGGFNAFNLPQMGGFPGTEQVSNVNTIFKNLRWYLVSNFRQVLSQLYVEIGLIQTIVDLPVEDALRGGVTIHSKQLDEDQIKQLQVALKRNKDFTNVAQAAKWNRLFGGAGLIVMTDQDPEAELDIDAINEDTPLEFRAVDLWELFWDKQNIEDIDLASVESNFEYYSYYGENVHKSRVLPMKGLEAPSFIRPRLRGWGFSIVEKLVRSMNQYLKGTDLTFEVLDEFKLDVYKMKNLINTLLSPNGKQKVAARIQMANWQKNYQNALVMDSEDDFDHKQLSFAGLAEAAAGIRKQVAADMRMPLTKLFGSSESGGIGNNDQNDMENYNSMVESEVRSKIEFDLLRVCELRCQQVFGFIPDDLEIKFLPLRMLTAEQEENVKTQKFNRLQAARDKGEITTFEFREACNKGSLFDISLDNAGDQLNPDDPEVGDLVEEGADAKKQEAAKEQMEAQGDAKDKAGEKKKPEKKENTALVLPRRYTRLERMARLTNSAEFDRASYEADGGDAWIHPGRREIFMNPMGVDEGLWEKAKRASVASFGKEKWQFVVWWYKKQGGKF